MHKITKDNNRNILKDIWQIHTDVQEQMLRLRSVPVSIIPDSAKIVGEKLYLTADENDKTDKIIDEIASTFKISLNEISTEEGYFFADAVVAQKIGEETKKLLSERASANFVNFQPLPIIDGYVNEKKSPIENLKKILEKSKFDYRFDEKERLQITIADLIKLKKITSDEKINIQIPEVASVIFPISVNLKHYITKNYPFVIEGNSESIIITNTITTRNSYFHNTMNY